MNTSLHASDDRLIDLASHLLAPEEERLVLAHIQQCSECEARFRCVLADRETARSRLAPSVRPDGNGAIAPPGRRSRRPGAVALVAFAAVAIALIGYVASHRSTAEPYWMPMEMKPSLLRSSDGAASGTSSAFDAYAHHDAAKTIQVLESAPPTDDETIASLQRLMLASAYVNNRQPKEALYVLEKLEIFSLPVTWREEAQWVEYLALRDSGQKDEARARLNNLAAYDTEIGARARAARR